MKSIKAIMMYFCIGLIALFTIGVGFSLQANVYKLRSFSMSNVRSECMSGYDDSVRYQVQSVIYMLNTIYNDEQKGLVSHEVAQEKALVLIKGLRYGDDGSGYFWVDNEDYTLVAHPILPQNEG